MTHKLLVLVAIAALSAESPALAKSCRIQSTDPPGQWKFFRAYDADTGAVVLRQAINGGDSKPVTVSGRRVRVETKLPGHTRYQPAVVVACTGGNTIKF